MSEPSSPAANQVISTGMYTPPGAVSTSSEMKRTPTTQRKAFATPEKGDTFYKTASRLMKRQNGEIKGTSSIMFNNGNKITKFARSNLLNNSTNRERVEMLLREFFLAKEAGILGLGPEVFTEPNSSIIQDPETKEYFLVIQMKKLKPYQVSRINQNVIDPKKNIKFSELYGKLKEAGFNVNNDFHTGQILINGNSYKYTNYGRVRPTGNLKKIIQPQITQQLHKIFKPSIKTKLFD